MKKCPRCKSEFRPVKKDQKYCSKFCGRAAIASVRRVKQIPRDRECEQCGNTFTTKFPHARYCSAECRTAAVADRMAQDSQNPRTVAIERLRGALVMVERARTELLEVDPVALSRIESKEDACRVIDQACERHRKDAVEIADNVTANRAARFLSGCPEVRRLLSNWSVLVGLTEFDADAIWAKMKGDPRPVEIAPEEPAHRSSLIFDAPVTDPFDDDEDF